MHEPVAIDRGHAPGRLQRLQQRAQPRGPEGHAAGERGHPHAAGARVTDVLLHHRVGRAVAQQRQVRDQRGRLALEAWRGDVEQRAAADGHHGRVRADDEAVARERDERGLEPESREGRPPGRQLLRLQQEHARHDLARPGVQADAIARLQRAGRVGQQLERAVHQPGRHQGAGEAQHVPALDGGALDALQIDGGALARARLGHRMPVRLQAAHLGLQRRREDLHPIVHAEPPGHERPGHDGAEALDGEDAIDRQPRELVGAARRHLGRQVAQRDAERVQPLPGPRRHREAVRSCRTSTAGG